MNFSFIAKKHLSIGCGLLFLGLISLTACRREEIKVYYTSKDNEAPSVPAGAVESADDMGGTLPAGHPSMGAGQAQITYKVPAGWTEEVAGKMRVASFSVKNADGKSAEISVVPLPGLAGGNMANVNLWRQQVSLPPANNEELRASASGVQIGGQAGELFELTGKNPSSGEPRGIIGGIQYRDDTSWFFKMTGDPELLAQQKGAFLAFLKSVNFAPAAAPVMPSMTAAPMDGPISHEGQPKWKVPSLWQEVSGGQMLIAKFMITDESGTQAAVNVSASVGDGGGLAANVNRWRGQLGLTPFSAEELAKAVTAVDVAGGKGTVVEMNGKDVRTGRDASLIGVMVPQAGQTWFYKLMGPSAIVTAEKDTFLNFVKTVQY